MTSPDSPYTWLWKEIARRFGEQQAADLYEQFLAQNRAYQRSYRGNLPPDAPPQHRNGRRPGPRKRTMKER